MTGLADALLDSVPLVAITGQVRARAAMPTCFGGFRCKPRCRRARTPAVAAAAAALDLPPSQPTHPSHPHPLSVQVPRKLIGSDAFQETPIVEVTRQVGRCCSAVPCCRLIAGQGCKGVGLWGSPARWAPITLVLPP